MSTVDLCVCWFSRSRRHLAAALNKEGQFSFSEPVDESADLDAAITYYQLDDGNDAVFPPLPVRKPQCGGPAWNKRSGREDKGRTSNLCSFLPQGPVVASPPHPPSGPAYRVQRSSGPVPPAPPSGNTPVCSSEEDQEDTSTVEDQREDQSVES